ncbi:MAG: glycosyltransferase family 4 protein [Planctomycetota bacterium]|jgi:glycosyltransferase involved in cell wall biosynthesis
MNYRLLMLNYEFPPIGGGAGQAHLSLLTRYAGNSELKVDVLTSAPKPGFFTESFSENITIYKVGIHKKDLHFWRRAEVIEWLLKAKSHYRRLLRENDYDLVHAFFGFPTAWLCYRSANKLPYIISLRGSDVPGYNIRLGLDYKLMAGLFRRIWSGAALVVANSNGLRELALEFMPALDIRVIPNGVDTEKFRPSEEQTLTKPIQALTVCRLISRKRIDLLIRAVARAKELGLDVQLNIAGHGNLMEQLRRLADELNIADSVAFMGAVLAEQMPQLYRDNDILVMSSAHEGMSNAMLEAMASGLPIITTRCEGVEELVVDNGLVVEQANAEQIAKAIRKIADDRQAHKQMSIAARRQAEKFGWSKVALSYIEQYHKILN